MQRRLYLVSLALALAFCASTASAQLIRIKKVNHDPNVKPAACNSAVGCGDASCGGGCSGGCGGTVLPGACGCSGGACGPMVAGNTTPCGAGGCAGGGCSSACASAPYGYCLYQNNCGGACGSHCKTIFHEMAMSLRRRALGRKPCGGCGGGLFNGGLMQGACSGSGDACSQGGILGGSLLEASCGCESAGCTGGCGAMSGAGGGILDGSLLEASCGCEDAGCGGCSVGGALGGCETEASCGCEQAGCTGGCVEVTIGDGCTGGAPMPCVAGSGGLLSNLGGLLFGRQCGCSSCTMSDVNLGGEASCGCEDSGCSGGCGAMGPTGCASNTKIRQPRGQVVSPEQAFKSRLLTRQIVRKPVRTAKAVKRTTPRDIHFASGHKKAPIEHVGFEEQIQQPVQFMKK